MTDQAVDVKRDPMQEFKDKVAERLRDQIGDLIPDEALAKMVEDAMQKAFFEGRVTKKWDGYRHSETSEPPWFVSEVKGLVDARVKEAVINEMNKRAEDLDKIIEERLEAGMSQMVLKTIDDVFRNAFQQVGFNLQQDINNAMQNIGN